MLPFSTHEIFKVNGDNKWIRTVTDQDGNCFFHSYAYSVEANEFRKLSMEDRKKRILTIKSYIADNISLEDSISIIFPDMFESYINSIEFIMKKVDLEPIDLSKQPLLSIKEYNQLLYKKYPILLQYEPFSENIKSFMSMYHSSLQRYIKSDGTWVFDSIIPLIMKILSINIIIISHDTLLPISHMKMNECPYTIYMYHIHNHFESVGLYKDEKMTRVFEKIYVP
jgi:hypothetical protein